MNSNPIVSIICACYNQSKFVLESLNSIANQTFKDYEVIIWDDASVDNSVEIIEQWIASNPSIEVQFVKHKENLGICRSLNECFRISKGKYIQILALDDILLPWKLEKHVAILENSTDKDALIFTDAFIINDDGDMYQNRFIALHRRYLSLETGNYYKDLLDDNFIPAMSVLLKRSVVEEMGLWDESLPFEDYDMWLRLAKRFDFIFEEETSVNYRLHTHNTHKIYASSNYHAMFDILMKHVGEPQIEEKLKRHMVFKYLNKQLKGEQYTFYKNYGVKGIKDYWIKYNLNVFVYRVINKVF